MHEPDDPSHTPRGVSVAEAARLLGIAPSTVRRHIRDGSLDAIRELRPQGSAWRVILPSDTSHGASEQRPRAGATTADGASHAPHQEAAHEPPRAPTGATAPTAMRNGELNLIALTALVEALAATRDLAEQRAVTVASLSERLGYVTAERDAVRAELDALRGQNAVLLASTAEQAPEPSTLPSDPQTAPWWRTPDAWIMPAVALAAIVLVVIVLVLSAIA